MQTAMATTLFHWTLHPWAIYAVVGLAIAYSTFRRGRRQTISAVFTPLIGEKHANGGVGRVIDILAIFATLFGSAASLGLGALQIGSGFKELGWMEQGRHRTARRDHRRADGGLRRLRGLRRGEGHPVAVQHQHGAGRWCWPSSSSSPGPTIIILDLLPTSIGAYFGDLPQLVGRTEATGGEGVADWLGSWTVFYWAWWISWTPFVGMFIARISRGRTIRQFVGGVILVPSTVSLLWFAIFGGTAMKLQEQGELGEETTPEGQLFGVLQRVPDRHA